MMRVVLRAATLWLLSMVCAQDNLNDQLRSKSGQWTMRTPDGGSTAYEPPKQRLAYCGAFRDGFVSCRHLVEVGQTFPLPSWYDFPPSFAWQSDPAKLQYQLTEWRNLMITFTNFHMNWTMHPWRWPLFYNEKFNRRLRHTKHFPNAHAPFSRHRRTEGNGN